MTLVRLPDDLALANLPVLLGEFLASLGWSRTIDQGGNFSRWVRTNSDGPRSVVLVPEHAEYVDFARRVMELVTDVATAERMPVVFVLEELRRYSYDVVRLMIEGDLVANGSIPFLRGADCIYSAREVLVASAQATHEHRAVLGPRRHVTTDEYLDRVRLGAPERGSFIVTMLSPVPAQTASFPFANEEPTLEPFERKVMVTLLTAMERAQAAARTSLGTSDFHAFDGLEQIGVSANLCESMVRLMEALDGTTCKIAIRWSPRRKPPAGVADSVQIQPALRDVLAGAARYIRRREPVAEFEVEGPVVKLERRPGDLDGVIGVPTLVDRRVQMVRVALFGEDYTRAAEAHKNDLPIRCRGELTRNGKFYYLRSVQDVQTVCEDADASSSAVATAQAAHGEKASMPQDADSGRRAAKWGYDIARRLAGKLGARLLGPNSNACEFRGHQSVIKSAHADDIFVGVTYKMLDRVATVIANFEQADGTFHVFEVPAPYFREHMRDSAGSNRGKVGLISRAAVAASGPPFAVFRADELVGG